jgi:hypothetical protein
MLPEADPLPHLICSRPMFFGGVNLAQQCAPDHARHADIRQITISGWSI